MWLFYREDSARRHLKDEPLTRRVQLSAWRVNTGPAGGDSGPLFRQLAEANGLQAARMELLDTATVTTWPPTSRRRTCRWWPPPPRWWCTKTFTPALGQLLLQGARQAHGDAGWFSRSREYPNPVSAEFPLSPEAERFYRSGPPWLQRYLSF